MGAGSIFTSGIFEKSNKVIDFTNLTDRNKVSNICFFSTEGNEGYVDITNNNLLVQPTIDIDVLESDIFRGGTTYQEKTLHKSIKSVKDTEEIDKCIKESLGVDDELFAQLKKSYSQVPSYFLKGPAFNCLMATGISLGISGTVAADENQSHDKFKINLYYDGEKLFLEAQVKDPYLENYDKCNIGIIPGTIAFRFVLTDDGFKLEKFAATNQLLFDLTIKDKISDFWYRLAKLRAAENTSFAELTPYLSRFDKFRLNLSKFFARNWPYIIGFGLAVAVGIVIAVGIASFGIGPAIIVGVAVAVKALAAIGLTVAVSSTAALITGSAALVVGAVASYAVLLGGAIVATKLFGAVKERFFGEPPIKETTPTKKVLSSWATSEKAFKDSENDPEETDKSSIVVDDVSSGEESTLSTSSDTLKGTPDITPSVTPEPLAKNPSTHFSNKPADPQASNVDSETGKNPAHTQTPTTND